MSLEKIKEKKNRDNAIIGDCYGIFDQKKEIDGTLF